jgi:8-oxo-dGTP pyrophosphatase MutT (NUDIX family)
MRQPFEVLVFVHRPGAGGKEFLVLHRVDEGYWHGLAGGIELGETPHEAAVREVAEESGLDVSAVLRATGEEFLYPLDEEPERAAAFPPETPGILVTCFLAEAPAGWEPVLNEEHDDYRWAPLAEAAALYRWDDARAALLHAGALLEVAA